MTTIEFRIVRVFSGPRHETPSGWCIQFRRRGYNGLRRYDWRAFANKYYIETFRTYQMAIDYLPEVYAAFGLAPPTPGEVLKTYGRAEDYDIDTVPMYLGATSCAP
jgi:hypothetical protein